MTDSPSAAAPSTISAAPPAAAPATPPAPAAPPPVSDAAPAAPAAAAPSAPPAPPAPWYAAEALGFDQETRDYLGGKNFASLADGIKALRQFETMARDRNAVGLPAEGKAGDWEHWDKLGWVADPAKYAVEPPKLPEGVPWNQDLQAAMLRTLHGQHVPLPAAKAAIDELGRQLADGWQKGLAEDQARVDADMAKLRALWGGKYDEKMELAKRVVRSFGQRTGAVDMLDDLMGFAPVAQLLADIGSQFSEDAFVSAAAGSAARHPASARAERLRLEADRDFMASITDARHPLHQSNTERRNRLLAQEAERNAA